MRLSFTIVLLGLLASFAVALDLKFISNLDGQQVVPPVASLGEGTGVFTFHPDDDNTLDYDIQLDFLEDVTGAHIHGPARLGQNADPLFTLEVDDDEIEGSVKLSSDIATALKRGQLYVAVHTKTNPDGEIRGQILTTAKNFVATLKGSNEVPPILSKFEGKGSFQLDYESKELKYQISHNVKDATAAHIHGPATTTQNGDVLVTFDSPKSTIKGTHILTEQHFEFLRSGLLYVNIHTEANANGEIRGQILIDEENQPDDGGGWDWLFYGVLFTGFLVALLLGVVAGLIVYRKRDVILAKLNKKKKGSPLSDGISPEPLLAEDRA